VFGAVKNDDPNGSLSGGVNRGLAVGCAAAVVASTNSRLALEKDWRIIPPGERNVTNGPRHESEEVVTTSKIGAICEKLEDF
jgi:hypothetical protein